MRVVLLSYEFTYAPFSGNGMLARALSKALVERSCAMRIICCRPACVDGLSQNNHLDAPSPDALELWPVQLSEEDGWRRLDDSSAYKAFWDGAASFARAARAFCPDVVIAIDWTGVGAWKLLRKAAWANEANPPLCYLNFRVYSSGAAEEMAAWYDHMELAALVEASRVLALSPTDQRSLQAMQSKIAHRAPTYILMPPIRSDIEALALAHSPSTASRPPSALSSAVSNTAPARRFFTCAVRLSPEKQPIRFVRVVQLIATELHVLGIIPLLFGATADAEYASEVKAQLSLAFNGAVIVEEFMEPPAIAAAFKATALNFHPCRYDAFGMSIVEAAAFGAPSMINGGGSVGASELLPANEGASFELSYDKISDANLAMAVLQLLKDRDRLESVGWESRRRSLQWNQSAYGAALHQHLHEMAASDGTLGDFCL